MTKIDALRRVFLPCFTPTTSHHHHHHHHPTTTTKKRLSTSLRDDIITTTTTTTQEKHTLSSDHHHNHHSQNDDVSSSSSSPSSPTNPPPLPPRSSKTMVTGTIFGHRRGPHVWFAVQHHRLDTRPYLLLQLSIPTQSLVQEMRFGLVRLALECHAPPDSGLASVPLRSVPVWTMFCNGRKLGFAVRKKATDPIRLMLRSVQSTTVGAGVIPSFGFDEKPSGSGAGAEEVIYMRASYECIVGGPDSESFHLINPDGCLGQELSIFLMRSR